MRAVRPPSLAASTSAPAAGVDQPFHHRGVAATGRQHQRGDAEEDAVVERGAGFVQHFDDFDIAALGFAVVGGLGERRPALRRLGVDVGTGRDQHPDGRDMAAVGGVHQRGLTSLVGGGMVGTGIEQILDLRGIAALGGSEQFLGHGALLHFFGTTVSVQLLTDLINY